jgi:hypothetical protein
MVRRSFRGLGSKSKTSNSLRGVRRRCAPTIVTALAALAAQSCGLTSTDAGTNGASAAGSGGQTAAGGSLATGGSVTIVVPDGGGALNAGGGSCAADTLPLADQRVEKVGAQRVFYSWTTDEQIAELRAGGPLFSRSESPGQGRGLLFTQLASYASAGSEPARTLAGLLESGTFAKARFAWPNPWATLLGWPGEAYGTQLLQVELKAEAWLASFDGRALTVYDAQGELVPIETALMSPERIGAIYYQAAATNGASYCGTFSQGAVGFREFALGNLAMVQRWSLSTPEIAARLTQDIAALQAFQKELSCLFVPAQPSWSDSVSCEWGQRFYDSGALADYDMALGIPSELYWPSSDNLSALIAALQASTPTGEPLLVTPGQ